MLANKKARNGGSCRGLAAEDQPPVIGLSSSNCTFISKRHILGLVTTDTKELLFLQKYAVHKSAVGSACAQHMDAFLNQSGHWLL
jgi:hypothetical protein